MHIRRGESLKCRVNSCRVGLSAAVVSSVLPRARPWRSRVWGLRAAVTRALQAARRAAPPPSPKEPLRQRDGCRLDRPPAALRGRRRAVHSRQPRRSDHRQGGGSGQGRHADRPGSRADRQLRRVRRDQARKRVRPRQDQGQQGVHRRDGSDRQQGRRRRRSDHRTAQGHLHGAIVNWSEVGGADEPVVVINRASGSGTRATFEAAVLQGEGPLRLHPAGAGFLGHRHQDGRQHPGAISYVAFSYYDDSFKALKVAGVEPKAANVEDNSWTIWAYEHMYTAATPDEATQAFIDYIMSDEVQGTLINEQGYIPVSGMKVEKDASGKVVKL